MARKLSWTPVRRGVLYCAPACGRGCTRVEYLEAHRAADRCRAKLKTPLQWKVVVHENLGWHWKLTNGPIQLYEHAAGRYVAMVSTDPKDPSGGSSLWTPHPLREHANPNKAVEAAVLPMCAVVAELERLRDYVLDRIPPIRK